MKQHIGHLWRFFLGYHYFLEISTKRYPINSSTSKVQMSDLFLKCSSFGIHVDNFGKGVVVTYINMSFLLRERGMENEGVLTKNKTRPLWLLRIHVQLCKEPFAVLRQGSKRSFSKKDWC